MASVTITLTDTPTGGVAIHTDFKPAIGQPCSPAQGAVLDIIARTKRDWNMANLSGDVNAVPTDKRYAVVQ